MKKNSRLTFSLACTLFLYLSSHAIPKGPYFKVGVGAMQCERFKETDGGYVKKNLKSNYVYNLGLGYQFNRHIRTDVIAHYTLPHYQAKTPLKNNLIQEIETIALLINIYYDINYFNRETFPYLISGIGIGKNYASDLKETTRKKRLKGESTINFVWNIGFGIKFDNLSRDYSIETEYRIIDYGKIKTNNLQIAEFIYHGGTQKIKGQQILAILTYKF